MATQAVKFTPSAWLSSRGARSANTTRTRASLANRTDRVHLAKFGRGRTVRVTATAAPEVRIRTLANLHYTPGLVWNREYGKLQTETWVRWTTDCLEVKRWTYDLVMSSRS